MTEIYTTENLLQILAEEYRACVSGKRLNLAAQVSGVNPLIDKFLNPEGIQKFTAYQDFRASVHRYQIEHQVSGIVRRQMTLRGVTLTYPEVDEQLIALPRDLEILRAAKQEIFAFWALVTTEMALFLAVNQGQQHEPILPVDLERIAGRTEWATLARYDYPTHLELVLQLGWGEPREARYQRGWPQSGSEFVYALTPGYRPSH